MSNWSTLNELQSIVERGYQELGYTDIGNLGYRFLSSPESTLGSDRLILSINPAGNRPDFENDSMFTPEGISAYVHEKWMAAPMGSSKLQVQYQQLFKFLDWDPLNVLQAPLSPYRYPSWSKIPSTVRRRTIAFCVSNIWKPYFAKHVPTQIVCVGKPPAEAICEAIPRTLVSVDTVPTGWNNSACDRANIYRFEGDVVMIQIPHLSRFGIMTANTCQDQLPLIFEPFLTDRSGL